MAWAVKLKSGAEEDLSCLDKPIRKQILNKLSWLEENFDNIMPLALSQNLAGFYKLRAGDWRVVYKVNIKTKEINVVAIDHRSNIYDRFE